MKKKPLVSIILPTYNGYKTIERTIDSILRQSYSEYEILIIDDGSNKKTKKKLEIVAQKDKRIKVITNKKNVKLIKTLNKGINIAKGKYIARIDDDDVWIDNKKLMKQILFLEQNPKFDLIGTNAINIGIKTSKTQIPLTNDEIKKVIQEKNPFVHSSVVFRKKKEYSYNLSAKHCEDYELWIRISKKAKIKNIRDYSVKRSIHTKSISHKHALAQAITLIKILNKNFKPTTKQKIKILFNAFTNQIKSWFL